VFYTEPRFWLYLATLTPFALCFILYGLRSPWRSSVVGVALFTLYGSIVAVLVFAVLALSGVVPEPLRAVLRAVFLGVVSLAGWLHLAMILRLQRRDLRIGESDR
jgi:hypothetical protein